MIRLAHQHRLSLLTVLILCLSWSVWLQGNHVHVADHIALDACVVCQNNAASVPSAPSSLEIIHTAAIVSAVLLITVTTSLLKLRPPVRGPPVTSIFI